MINDWHRQVPPAMAIAASFILRSLNAIEEFYILFCMDLDFL
jgi:hypothetical protein